MDQRYWYSASLKKDIDDLRESPSLTVIELLQKEGAEVSYNDPFFPKVGRGRKYDLKDREFRLRADRYRSLHLRPQGHRAACEACSRYRNATKGIFAENLVRC